MGIEQKEKTYRQLLARYVGLLSLKREGFSYRAAAAYYNITRQRAHAILSKGWPYPSGSRTGDPCMRSGCERTAAMRDLCPLHYAKRYLRRKKREPEDVEPLV